MTASPKRDVQRRWLAALARNGQERWIVFLAFSASIFVDGLEIGRKRERERVVLGEQSPLLRVDAPQRHCFGVGPGFGHLGQDTGLDRLFLVLLLRQQRG